MLKYKLTIDTAVFFVLHFEAYNTRLAYLPNKTSIKAVITVSLTFRNYNFKIHSLIISYLEYCLKIKFSTFSYGFRPVGIFSKKNINKNPLQLCCNTYANTISMFEF